MRFTREGEWSATQETYNYDYRPFEIRSRVDKSERGEYSSVEAVLFENTGH